MAKCLNCTDEAMWLVETKGARPQVFCDKDLPWFLRKDAQEGTLPRVDKPADPKPTPPVKEPAKKSDSNEG
jgi:hypothetical protein